MYKPMDTGISNICSSGRKFKSCIGVSTSIIGTMGIPVMDHTTWDDLVSWVGTHIEQLA